MERKRPASFELRRRRGGTRDGEASDLSDEERSAYLSARPHVRVICGYLGLGLRVGESEDNRPRFATLNAHQGLDDIFREAIGGTADRPAEDRRAQILDGGHKVSRVVACGLAHLSELLLLIIAI